MVAVDDREWFVAVGYGLEGMIPDAVAKRISDRYFPDAFRASEYARGVQLFLDDVAQYIDGDEWIIDQYNDDDTVLWLVGAIIAIVFLLLV